VQGEWAGSLACGAGMSVSNVALVVASAPNRALERAMGSRPVMLL
jgi:hypothetical protein